MREEDIFAPRREKVYRWMEEEKLDGFLIHSVHNRNYLSGFYGSEGYLYLAPGKTTLYVDFRYQEKAQGLAKGDLSVEGTKFAIKIKEFVLKEVEKSHPQRIGFESHLVTVEEWNAFKEILPGVEWVPCNGVIEKHRAFKSPVEIQLIQESCRVLGNAFQHLFQELKPGMTEREVALEMDYTLRKNGADGMAFDTIVLSGARTSMPHGTPSEKKIEEGDIITVDAGAWVSGYCSDVTRTFVLGGSPTQKMKEVFEIVERAQEAAMSALTEKIPAREVDLAARSVIQNAGYGEAFGHGLGHGLGLEVHELPRLSNLSEDTLDNNMVVTIEPGIYLPGEFGIRLEETVVIQNGSGVALTSFIPKPFVL